MSEHVRRGAFLDEGVAVPGEMGDDDYVLKEFHCQECGEPVGVRCRANEAAYVRLGCPCGAVELGLRIADIVADGIDEWTGEYPERDP